MNESLKFYARESKRVLKYLKHPLHRYLKLKRYGHAIEMVKLNKNNKVLEVGCGTGYQIPIIIKKCKNYIGIDFSKENIKLCKKIKNINVITADANKIPFKENSFDIVLMIDVLCDLHNPEKSLEEVNRVLKDNGKFIISVPNNYSFYGLTKFLLKKMRKWNYKSIPPVDNWYTPSSIISILKRKGFKIEEIRGSFFLPPFFNEKYYLIPSWKIVPRIYDKFEVILSRTFKCFGYHIILSCSKVK